jgi:hypothetical protein
MTKKQEPTVFDFPLPGMTCEQSLAWLGSARSKTDLEDWKPGPTFHLDRIRGEMKDDDRLD